jgi:hypothetical protein
MAVDFFQFVMNLLLAGLLLRFLQMKLADSDLGKALAFIY